MAPAPVYILRISLPFRSLQIILKKSAQVACILKNSIAHLSHENIITVDTGPSHPDSSGPHFFCFIANKFICFAISDGAATAAQDGPRNLHGVIIPSPA